MGEGTGQDQLANQQQHRILLRLKAFWEHAKTTCLPTPLGKRRNLWPSSFRMVVSLTDHPTLPDLNHIENLWAWVKRYYGRYIERAYPVRLTGLSRKRNASQLCAIPNDYLQRLAATSLPRRLEANQLDEFPEHYLQRGLRRGHVCDLG